MVEKARREPALTDNAKRIFDLRYSLKDEDGNPIEAPADSIHRVAENVASVTLLYQDFDPPEFGYLEDEEWYEFPVRSVVRQWNYLSRTEVLPDIETLATTGMRLWKARTRKYSDLLTDLLLVPNSPTWTGAGTPLSQYAACFVLPISDNLGRARDSICS